MIVNCTEISTNLKKIYGMGKNQWGQLGLNPFDVQFVHELKQEIKIDIVKA
jgi:hypothetical protein